MIRIQNVLCPVDFSAASKRALDYAVGLARGYGARLHVLHVIAPIVPSLYVDATRLEATIRKHVHGEMPKLLARARHSGVEAEPIVKTGEIEKQIQAAARAVKAEVVVMGKHARPAVERWFIGSTTDRLLRHSATPLLMIGEGKRKRTAPADLRRIVVTTDFSEGSQNAIQYAISLGESKRANILLLHVVPPAITAITPPVVPILVEPLEAINQARLELENLVAADARERCSVETKVETGEPYREILNVLKQTRADLLVMNIHGKGRLERALLGSTAERVIRGAPCPVMAIPPAKQRLDIGRTKRRRTG